MNKVLVSVSVLMLSVLISIVGVVLYSVGDVVGTAARPLGSWAIIVFAGFAVVFGFLLGIKYMSSI
jgi:hypothetical protein